MGKNKKKNSNYITKASAAMTTAPSVKKASLSSEAKAWLIALVAVILLIAIVVVLIVQPWKKTVYVKMTIKDMGDMIIELDPRSAPKTVENFVSLVNRGYYDGTGFHRAVEGFMVQGGQGDSKSSIKPIYGEFSENGFSNNKIKHKKGVISMARTNDPDSATSEFFICNDTNATVSLSLDGKYAGFGIVIEGLEIIDMITEESLRNIYYGEYVNPNAMVTIEKAVVLTDYKK